MYELSGHVMFSPKWTQNPWDPENSQLRVMSLQKKSNVIWTLIISCSLTAWYPLQIMFK